MADIDISVGLNSNNLLNDGRRVIKTLNDIADAGERVEAAAKDLNKSLGNSSKSSRNFAKALKEIDKVINPLLSRLERYRTTLNNTDTATRNATASSRAYGLGMSRLESNLMSMLTIQRNLVTELGRLNRAQTSGATSTSTLAARHATLSSRLERTRTQSASASRQLEELANSMRRVSRASAGMSGSLGTLNTRVSAGTGLWTSLATAVGAYFSAVGAGNVIDTLQRLDQLDAALLTVSGSSEKLAYNQAFLSETADRLGLDVLSMTDNFIKFTAAAQETSLTNAEVRDIFTAVSESSRALGLTTEDTKGAFRALTQIMSKGSVQAEELRGQLGERFPGAVQIAAKAMGVTTAELNKMLEMGQLVSDEFLLAYSTRLPEAFQLTEAATRSLNSEINRLNNAWISFVKAVGDAGLVSAIKDTVRALADILKSSSFIDGIITSMGVFGAVVDGVSNAFDNLSMAWDQAASALTPLTDLLPDTEGDLDDVRLIAESLGYVVIPALTYSLTALAAVRLFGLIKQFPLLSAAAAGVTIGNYLREEFVEARVFGAKFVEGLLVIFESLKFGIISAFDIVSTTTEQVFRKMLSGILYLAKGFIDHITNLAQAVNVNGILDGPISGLVSVSETLGGVYKENSARMDENTKVIDRLVARYEELKGKITTINKDFDELVATYVDLDKESKKQNEVVVDLAGNVNLLATARLIDKIAADTQAEAQDKLNKKILAAQEGFDELIRKNDQVAKAEFDQTLALKSLKDAYNKLNAVQGKTVQATFEYAKAKAAIIDKFSEILAPGQAYIKNLEKEVAKLKETTAALNEYRNAAVAAAVVEAQGKATSVGKSLTDEEIRRVVELVTQREKLNGVIEDTKKNLKDYEEASVQTAFTVQSAWQEVSDTFANMWKDALKDFDSFADGLEDRLKDIVIDTAFQQVTSLLVANTSTTPGISSTVQGPPTLQTQKAIDAGQGNNNLGAAASLAGLGPYGAIAAAVVVGVSAWNDKEDERFKEWTAEYRQGVQFTGTILGNANAKSESIRNGIEEIAEYSSGSLDVNNKMLLALESLAYGIGELSKSFQIEFARNPLELGTFAGRANEFTQSTFGPAGSLAEFGASGPIGKTVDLLADGILSDFISGVFDGAAKLISNKKKSVIDSGVRLIGSTLSDIVTSGGVEAFQYAITQVTRRTFGIKKKENPEEVVDPITGVLEGQIAGVFIDAEKALSSAIMGLGLTIEQSVLDNLSFETIDISLKDMSDEEITKAFEQFFSSTLDGWAETVLLSAEDVVNGVRNLGSPSDSDRVFGVKSKEVPEERFSEILLKYQEAGEGAFETLVRLSAQTQQVVHWANMLNLSYDSTGLAVIDLVQSLADASGGFDKLNANLTTYYNKFFTEEERQRDQLDALNKVFDDLGLVLPETRQGFRDLVESLRIDPGADQDTVARLLEISGAADQLYSTQEGWIESLGRIYQEQLGREPDASGLKNYLDLLEEGGISLDQISQAIANSPEAITNYINSVYDEVLGRKPDTAGFDFYFSLLEEGKIKFGELAEVIKTDLSDQLNVGGSDLVGPVQDPKRVEFEAFSTALSRDLQLGGMTDFDRDRFLLQEWLSETLENIDKFGNSVLNLTDDMKQSLEDTKDVAQGVFDQRSADLEAAFKAPLKGILEGARDTLNTINMSDFEKAVYSLNRETDEAINKANELMASEGTLKTIRDAASAKLGVLQNAEAKRLGKLTGSYGDLLKIINETDFSGFVSLGEDIQKAISDAGSAGASERFLEITKDLSKAHNDVAQAYVKEKEALKNVMDEMGKLGEQIRNFDSELVLGGLSVLSTEDKFQFARREFNQVSSLARSGDIDAIARYEDVARDFLTASREFQGANASVENFNLIRSANEEIVSITERQIQNAEDQLEQMTKSVEKLTQIEEKVLSLEEAIVALRKVQQEAGKVTVEELQIQTETLNDIKSDLAVSGAQ